MRISDWSSDVCSSDLGTQVDFGRAALIPAPAPNIVIDDVPVGLDGARQQILERASPQHAGPMIADDVRQLVRFEVELLHRQPEMIAERLAQMLAPRSEEHTSELQSLMRISSAVFCFKKKNHYHTLTTQPQIVL